MEYDRDRSSRTNIFFVTLEILCKTRFCSQNTLTEIEVTQLATEKNILEQLNYGEHAKNGRLDLSLAV